ncbi:MAG: flagellar motor protein MotA [Rhodospirillales bacterium]
MPAETYGWGNEPEPTPERPIGRPTRFLIRMLVFLVAVAAVSAVLFAPLREAFMSNAPLNGLILGVLLLGIFHSFRQVLRLKPEVAWIESFRQGRTGPEPRLLAPMATMLGEKRDRLSLSAQAMRSLLDGIANRLDESRELSRYTIGLLIFLGLLGTFWGLLETVASVGDVIGALEVTGGDMAVVFGNLKAGLEAPLNGMGTAFSSSLFGLAGSLVLGFLDLQANQAQNRFYGELEDWLSGVTRLSSGALSLEGEGSVPAYVQALLEQTADSLDNLQRIMARGEEQRQSTNANLATLAQNLTQLTDNMKSEGRLIAALAQNQSDIKAALTRIADAQSLGGGGRSGGFDEASRTHIRNLETHLAALRSEIGSGRDEVIQNVRNEVRLLARTIAALADGGQG